MHALNLITCLCSSIISSHLIELLFARSKVSYSSLSDPPSVSITCYDRSSSSSSSSSRTALAVPFCHPPLHCSPWRACGHPFHGYSHSIPETPIAIVNWQKGHPRSEKVVVLWCKEKRNTRVQWEELLVTFVESAVDLFLLSFFVENHLPLSQKFLLVNAVMLKGEKNVNA